MNEAARRPTTMPTRRAFQVAALASISTLIFVIPAAAADFPGSLKGTTITDAQTANKPPIAAFTYKQEGETITFDASTSSDPDGSITKYRWNFGDGVLTEGVAASYTPPSPASFKTTLTVVDNENGASLSQQTVALASRGIHDDFSTDTAVNYTVLKGGIKVANGAMHSSGDWTTTYALHNTELASDDHTVEADVYHNGSSGTGGLLLRFSKEQGTGYSIGFENGRIMLHSYINESAKWIALFDGNYTEGFYHLKCSIESNIIKVYVNDVLVLTKPDSTLTKGKHIGFRINPYGNSGIATIDNLYGK